MQRQENATTERMRSVKVSCDHAPSGPKKDAAIRHYQDAEKAHIVNDEKGTQKALDAARLALK